MKPVTARVFYCLILMLTITSCQKEMELPDPENCVVSEALFDDGTISSFLRITYDDQLRVVKQIYFEEDESDTLFSIYTKYEANRITVIEGEGGSTEFVKDTTVYTLMNGKVTSSVTRTPASLLGNRSVENISYQYNNDGYLSRTITTKEYPDNNPPDVYTTTVDYSYKDENVISETTTTDNAVYVNTYEYLTDKPVLATGAAGSYEVLTSPHVKNLVSKTTETAPSGSSVGQYSYTFASDGKVMSYKLEDGSGYQETTQLKYLCR